MRISWVKQRQLQWMDLKFNSIWPDFLPGSRGDGDFSPFLLRRFYWQLSLHLLEQMLEKSLGPGAVVPATFPETNSLPLKIGRAPKRKRSSSKHQFFRGDLLVFEGV